MNTHEHVWYNAYHTAPDPALDGEYVVVARAYRDNGVTYAVERAAGLRDSLPGGKFYKPSDKTIYWSRLPGHKPFFNPPRPRVVERWFVWGVGRETVLNDVFEYEETARFIAERLGGKVQKITITEEM